MLLQEFADAPEPDRGLLNYRQVSDKLGSTPWYLRLLRDGGPVARRLARVLSLSRYAADLLARDPEALRLLADDDRAARRAPGSAAATGSPPPPTGTPTRSTATPTRSHRGRPGAAPPRARSGWPAPTCSSRGGQPGPGAARSTCTPIGIALSDVTDATLGAALRAARRSPSGACPACGSR